MIKSEEKIINALPAPLAEFVSRNKHRSFLLFNAKDTQVIEEALDRSFRSVKKHVAADELETFRFKVSATRLQDGRIEIEFPYIEIFATVLGERAKSQNHEFPKLMFATLKWAAKRSETLGSKQIVFRGTQLVNKSLIEILERMGFKRNLFRAECPLYTAMGTIFGALGGVVTTVGFAVSREEADGGKSYYKQNLATHSAIGGGIGAIATLGLICTSGSKGYNYTLQINLEN